MQIKNTYLIIIFSLFLVGMKTNNEADEPGTIPCFSAAGESDLLLWKKWHCNADSVSLYARLLNLDTETWQQWGARDSLNVNKPYAKVLNSVFLLRNALIDTNFQWHGTHDYSEMGQAQYSSSHIRFRYDPSNERNWLAFAMPQKQVVFLGCMLFDPRANTDNPATRAGDFVHEGLHMWEYTYFGSSKHIRGPVGHCTEYGDSCDWYYWHLIRDYDFGYLWMWGKSKDGKRMLFHSSNQVQVEFLADLAEFSKPWVPKAIRIAAEMEANHRLDTRFKNIVGFRCGDPRPW